MYMSEATQIIFHQQMRVTVKKTSISECLCVHKMWVLFSTLKYAKVSVSVLVICLFIFMLLLLL